MNDKPMTIADYDKEVLQPAIKRFAECQVADDIVKANMIADYRYFSDGKKPSRWQKFKYCLQDYHQRAKDIWTILRGKDIHENCGY